MAEEINKKELTKEQMEKAMACKTADELMALAKAEGYELTKEEAEAFLAEVSEVELSDEVLGKAAGGYLPRPCVADVCIQEGMPCVHSDCWDYASICWGYSALGHPCGNY